MATTKPTKPTNLMPRHFADDGIKNNFSSAKISNGFSSNFEDILQGDNLNYMIDSIGKELQYLSSVVDFIVDMPINKTFKVNANNNLEYVSLVEDASNKANISLDNLNTAGQAKFDNKANIDLDNLSATGNAKLDNKANINLSNLSTTGQAKLDNKANISLDNLDTTGNNKILPSQSGNSNKYLTTNGYTPSWKPLNNIAEWLMPDYSRATTITYNSGDEIGFDGYLAITGYWQNTDTSASLYIDGCLIMRQSSANDNGHPQSNYNSVFVNVSSTDIITWQKYSKSNLKFYSIPYKGDN